MRARDQGEQGEQATNDDNSTTMSTRFTTDELEQIAREQDGDAAEKAVQILKDRGEVPKVPFEERHGVTAVNEHN